MRSFPAFKASCYPLNHLSGGDNGHQFFHARGDGLYPLIRDGDILHIQHATPVDLHTGDMIVRERPTGGFTVHFVVRNGWETQGTSAKTKKKSLNGNKELIAPERLVGRVTAIERDRRTKKVDDRFARLFHLIYLSIRPLMRILLVCRKVLSLVHPKFFVRGPELSLRSVAEKYHDAKEVLYYSQRAFAGLDEEERVLLGQFMKNRGRVLNIGCGAGREAFALAEAGFEVVGIDVSPPMIAEAKRHAQTSGIPIQFEIKDATALDYPSRSFDYVWISTPVYSHIPTRQLRIQTLRKVNELLTPKGMLFFSIEYRGTSFLSRVSLYGALWRLAKPIVKNRLHAEPGDILIPHVSPVGTPSRLCYCHFFKNPGEVLEEVSSANLDGFEEEQSGFWVVSPLKKGDSQRMVRCEVPR